MTFQPSFRRAITNPIQTGNYATGVWWNLFGTIPTANCIAAYSPKGAASLAASYVNLVTPGTYDAAPGTAPTWDATNGWKYVSGSSQYLATGVVNSSDWSIIVRFSNKAAGSTGILAGSQIGGNTRFYVAGNYSGTGNKNLYGYGNNLRIGAGSNLAGVTAICGTNCYMDGSADGTAGTWSGTNSNQILIGASYNSTTLTEYITAYIQAVAIYNNDQSANMAALYSAINAL